MATVLSFLRVIRNDAKASDVKIDPGGGPNITAEHFSSAGDDSHPLPGDFAVTNDVQRSGGEVIVGYLDPLNDQKANPGDKRIYARDANTGAMIVELWLKNDGSTVLSNANGSLTLQANGDFLINGVTIDTNGNISTSGTVNADDVTADNQDVTLSTHKHPASNTPPTPGT